LISRNLLLSAAIFIRVVGPAPKPTPGRQPVFVAMQHS